MTRIIQGLASTPTLDQDNDKIPISAYKESIQYLIERPLFYEFNTAIGTIIDANIIPEGLEITAEIHSNDIWDNIEKGILYGFGICGFIRKSKLICKACNQETDTKDQFCGNCGTSTQIIKEVSEMDITSIAIVKHPTNLDATFEIKELK